jgi:hypothetical protein
MSTPDHRPVRQEIQQNSKINLYTPEFYPRIWQMDLKRRSMD